MDAQPLKKLAELVSAQIIGAPGTEIRFALPLQDTVAGAITFVSNAKQTKGLDPRCCSAIITDQAIETCAIPQLVVANVREAFEQILVHLRQPPSESENSGIAASATVAKSASIGKNVQIGPGAHVGANSVIGENCVIHPGVFIDVDCQLGAGTVVYANVSIYQGTAIGTEATLHAGCVLGAHGFGYQPVEGRHQKTGQFGWVEVGDQVEIGANSTVDRGTYGPTRIGEGTKIDNLVQVGHNCQIGRHNLICAQVGIAGSTSTGDYVVLGGQVGIKDHVQIGNNVSVGAQSGIMRDVESDKTIFGSPAIDFKRKMLQLAATAKLPEIRSSVRALEEQVAALQQKLDSHDSKPAAASDTKAA